MALTKSIKKLDLIRESNIIYRTTGDANAILGEDVSARQIAQIIAAYFHHRSILDPGPESNEQVGLAQAVVTSI